MQIKSKCSLPSFGGELGLSYSYFNRKLLPSFPVIREKNVKLPTRRTHCDEIEFLFVRDGTGEILVNGQTYPLSTGSSGILYSWQIYEIQPVLGGQLNYVSIGLSYSTFMFILSAPSCNILPILPEDRFLWRFQGKELHRCSKLVDWMIASEKKGAILSQKNRLLAPLGELLARILWNLVEKNKTPVLVPYTKRPRG